VLLLVREFIELSNELRDLLFEDRNLCAHRRFWFFCEREKFLAKLVKIVSQPIEFVDRRHAGG
jgi:hypothetical protein